MASGVADGALIVDTKIDNSGSKRGAAEFKRQVDGMNKAVDQAGKSMASSLNGYLRSVGKTKGAAKQLEKEIAEIESQIQQLQQRQREWDAMGFKTTSAAFEELDQQIFSLQDKLDGLIAKRKELENQPSGGGMAQQVRETTQTVAEAEGKFGAFEAMVGRSVTGVIRMAGAWAKAGATIARIAGGGALSFLRKLAASAKNAAIQLAKLSGRAIAGGFRTLGSALASAGKWMLGIKSASAQANGGLKRGLMTILKYGLGIRSMYFLFRKLRQAISEGFTELAKHDVRTKASLESLQRALNGLKGSLATAFSPILTAVAPALTKLINMLASAINAIGAFIAALTGQRTYQKAVGGLNATGSAAGGAADNVKELNRQLAKFDDLDILSDKSNDSGGGGGGGGGGSGFTYETEQISGGILDFVDKLKELWANADYEGIGREIAGAINNAFESAKELISWDNLGEKITEAVDAITGIFNGLVDGINWTLIGETFGEGINTIVNTVNQLLTKINWENLGKKMAEGLNGLVSTVNWSNLGEMFANKLNALIDTIKGAVSGFKWGDAGTAFARAVTGLLTTVKWADLGGDFATLINGTIEALKSAITAFNWGEAGKTFGTAVSSLTTKVDWATLGGSLAQLLNSAVDALRSALSAFDWGEAGKTFAASINKILTTVKWAELGSSLAQLLNSALDALHSALAEFKWGEAGKAFGDAVSSLLTSVKWAQLGGDLATLLNGAVDALRSALAAFNWEDAGKTFSDTINSLISKVEWTELGKTLSASLKSALDWLVAALSQFNFGTTGQAFADAINGFFSDPTIWEKAGNAVSTAIKGLFTWGKDFLDKLDVDKISSDIKLALANVDWPGIAKAIWDFLVAAAKVLGKTLVDLFSPYNEGMEYDVNPYTGELVLVPKAGKGLKDNGDGTMALDNPVDGEAKLNFGLNLADDDERKAFEALNNAIQEALETGEWVAPVGLGVSDESIEAARQNFIERWDKEHPEAQIDPTIDKDDWQKEWDSVVGDELDVLVRVALLKNGWTTITAFVGEILPRAFKLGKDGWSTISAFVGNIGQKIFPLGKDKWTTIAAFVGEIGLKKFALGRDGWSTIAAFVGNIGTKSFALGKDGWKTIAAFVGNIGMKKFSLGRDGWTSISDFVGTLVKVFVTLANADKKKYTPAKIFGTAMTVFASLKNANSRKYTPAKLFGTSITVTAKLVKKPGDKITYTASSQGGNKMVVAKEGAIITRGGLARYLSGVPHYAGGTTRAHGTVFVAGEAGPEVMGHINGRTEILNRSQIAQSIYGAVVAGMGQAVNALGAYLANQMAACTNAITGTIGALSASAGFRFRAPEMASGGVLPYEVAAQVARTGEAIQSTLDANNEDLIQTIISVSAQVVAAVQSLQSGRPGEAQAVNSGMNLRQVVYGLNRQTQMFGASPLKGV